MACLASGPGKLVHPWLGEFQAVVVGKPRISFSEAEFGAARLDVTWERYDPPAVAKPDWFGKLQDQVDGLMDQARALLRGVLGAIAVPLAIIGFASTMLRTAVGVWDGLGFGSGGSAIAAVVAVPVAALADTPPATGVTYADGIADLLAAPALALADASQTQDAPAVAAASTAATVTTTPDPATAAAALLQAVTGFAAPAGASDGVATLCLAAQIQVAAQAAAVGATIPFDSANAAVAWRVQLDASLALLQAQAAALCASQPILVGPAWRAIGTLRTTAAADIAARAVQLPDLLSVTVDRTTNAWRIALALVGDTPSLMTSVVVDIWRRNPQIRNPAAVPPGTYDVLP
jgi:prophage DNA circulation protein